MLSDLPNRIAEHDSGRKAAHLLMLILVALAFFYGMISVRYEIFPYDQVRWVAKNAKVALDDVVLQELGIYRARHYYPSQSSEIVSIHDPDQTEESLNLVTAVVADDDLAVQVVDMRGHVVHRWLLDWWTVWPDAAHLQDSERPKSKPGTVVHGVVVMPNGDLIFNYEYLGMVRLDICGDVVWRLPYRTHHSVFVDDGGNIWASGRRQHDEPLPDFPNLRPPVSEDTVVKVSPDGELLQEISLLELLRDNDLNGLLYMSTQDTEDTSVAGDLLHLNDVEVFSRTMAAGWFEPGDILISLRNVNTVLVFDPVTRRIKFRRTGGFVRQHDPDFIDGDTISVYDNNHIAPLEADAQSRILILSVEGKDDEIYYQGTPAESFYSNFQGKHQWLPNGNLLIAESVKGRGFEVSPEGEIVWEYFNLVGDELVGWMPGIERLPSDYAALFTEAGQRCQ